LSDKPGILEAEGRVVSYLENPGERDSDFKLQKHQLNIQKLTSRILTAIHL
jgi:hypothetical protein